MGSCLLCAMSIWRMLKAESLATVCSSTDWTAYRGIVKEFLRTDGDGRLSLTRCCQVSGLGLEKSPNRDGSFDYYMSEPIRDNDAKGVAPFVWASLEMAKAVKQ